MWRHAGGTAGVHLACSYATADSGKRKKKGNELEQIDCTPPEHILPGSKERPLVPLQPQNKDWKVRKIDANKHLQSIYRESQRKTESLSLNC